MVITIELGMCKLPILVSSILTLLSSIGVYIQADPQFPKRSQYCMRIEDEVLVGAENLNSVVLLLKVCRHPGRIPLG